MYLVDFKSICKSIGFSLALMILLMYSIYGFEMSMMNISNVFFFTGISFFLMGLIVVSNCTEIFSSSGYIIKKMFSSRKGKAKFFRTYGEYKEYKIASQPQISNNGYAYVALILGFVYIVISIIMGYM